MGFIEDLEGQFLQIYGSSAIYVKEIERLSEKGGTKSARCLLRVSSLHASRLPDQPALDGFEQDANGKPVGLLNVTSKHAAGHFREVSVFPGHKGIRAAVAYVSYLMQFPTSYNLHPDQVHLVGFDSVDFNRPVLLGDQLEVSESGINHLRRTHDIEIKRGEDIVTKINGLKVHFFAPESIQRAALLEDQLIEAMIQAAAATALDLKEGSNGIPMFLGIGRTRFSSDRALEGSIVEITTATTADKRGFVGNVSAFVNGNEIAESLNMRAMIVPKRVAERMLGVKLTD